MIYPLRFFKTRQNMAEFRWSLSRLFFKKSGKIIYIVKARQLGRFRDRDFRVDEFFRRLGNTQGRDIPGGRQPREALKQARKIFRAQTRLACDFPYLFFSINI